MPKIKIKDISNREMNALCKNHVCDNCPLRRTKTETNGKTYQVWCYRRLRAWYYAEKIYYEELLKQPLSDAEKSYHEFWWEEKQLEHKKTEESEIEKTWD